jgi:hypothetical protein
MGVSFVLLAGRETHTGLNQKAGVGVQAFTPAEAAWEHDRDRLLRELAGTPPNFDKPTLGGTASDGSMLIIDAALRGAIGERPWKHQRGACRLSAAQF